MNRFLPRGCDERNQRDMDVALLDMPTGVCAPFEIGTLGALFESATTFETKLIRSDERLIKELVSVLDKQLLAALEARSVSEFAGIRTKVWPKYIRALRALSDTMSNVTTENEIDVISESAIGELVTDLQKQRGVRFGDKLIDQATFTLWTLGKIRSLGRKIEDAGEAPDKDVDLKLNSEYRLCSLWAQFHLDSVAAAMKFGRPIAKEIQATICDGLRSAVNAYAIMKEALRLRRAHVEPAPSSALPWDEEDERLLASSMRNINAFSDSEHS